MICHTSKYHKIIFIHHIDNSALDLMQENLGNKYVNKTKSDTDPKDKIPIYIISIPYSSIRLQFLANFLQHYKTQ